MVERLPVPTPFQTGPVNAYLAGGTLVDPGPDSEDARDALREHLADHDREPADVERVVVTHPHPDHFGLASWLRDLDAEIHATADAAALLRDFPARLDYEQAYFTALFEAHGMDPDTTRTVTELPELFVDYAPSVAVDRELAAGDAVPLGDREATVRALEGHAVGELALEFEVDAAAEDANSGADDAERVAIVGDHVLPATTPNPFLQPPRVDAVDGVTLAEAAGFDAYGPAELDALRPRVLPAYEDSLATLRDADLDRLLPGHGEPIAAPADRIAEIEAAHAERSDATLEAVDGPTTATAVMHELFEDLAVVEYFAGMSEALGHLDALERRGDVARRERDGELVYERT